MQVHQHAAKNRAKTQARSRRRSVSTSFYQARTVRFVNSSGLRSPAVQSQCFLCPITGTCRVSVHLEAHASGPGVGGIDSSVASDDKSVDPTVISDGRDRSSILRPESKELLRRSHARAKTCLGTPCDAKKGCTKDRRVTKSRQPALRVSANYTEMCGI